MARHETPEFKARWLNYGQKKDHYDKPSEAQIERGKRLDRIERMKEDIWLNGQLREEWDL